MQSPVAPLRAEIIELLWQQARDSLYISPEQFAQNLDGWEFDPLHNDKGLCAVFVVKGPEFHFAKFDDQVQISRAHIRQYPGALIERYGYALTRTPRSDTRMLRFNERLNFYRVGEDEFDIFFRIDHLRFKEKPCL